MISSGIRLGAWDYLKWKHVVPLTNDTEDVVAANITVYAGDIEEYYSFLKPEAYYSLKEWIYLLFRAFTNDYCLPIWSSLF